MNKTLIILITLAFASFIFSQSVEIKDNADQLLLQINDEGDGKSSITIPSSATSFTPTENKLYNEGGTLKWNGTTLATGGSLWTLSGGNVYRSTGNVGIGDNTPTFKLDINGKIGINDTQILYLPNQSIFEGTIILGNGGNNLNFVSGVDGYGNTAVGIGAFINNTTGYSNTFFGHVAGQNNADGFNNTFIGWGAGNQNISGNHNSFFGNGAGYSNTGSYNTFIGNSAGQFNTGGNENTFIGSLAGLVNTSGSNNIMIGRSAGYYNQEGSNNTIIGFRAGQGSTFHNKDGNVFIGYEAGKNETGSNKLYIENSDSNTPLIGGDFSTDEIYLNGKVGIGTSSPTSQLFIGDIYSDWGDTFNPQVVIDGVDNEASVTALRINDENDNIYFTVSSTGAGGSDKGRIYMAGNVGIGTTSPGSKLSIVGLLEYADNAAALTASLIAGDLYRTGDLLKIVH